MQSDGLFQTIAALGAHDSSRFYLKMIPLEMARWQENKQKL